jgi:hypothetical protein
MKNFLRIIMAVTLAVLCQYGHAAGDNVGDSPAVKVLESGRKSKKLEGTSLRVARPILKKTPISVILDDIEMMIICPLDKESSELTAKAERMLKSYTMVREINDEISHVFIYIDTPANEKFSELILYTESPETNIMLFEGNFTVDDLIKVGELSVQDRKRRIREKNQ